MKEIHSYTQSAAAAAECELTVGEEEMGGGEVNG
jgi:hypothetical protein